MTTSKTEHRSGVQIGLRLPTLLSQAGTQSELADLAMRAEAAEFDSLWCVDHLLAAQYVFGSAALDPLTLMPYLAGRTSGISLGVSVLVAPLRNPVWLLKQLGTLSYLAGDRILLGLGVGWDVREFEASGVDRRTRGARLDAIVAALADARREGGLVFEGVSIEPPPDRWGAVLCGGGSSDSVQENGQPVRMVERVLNRIARADGWVVRSSAGPELVQRDLSLILERRAELGLSWGYAVARANFFHLSTSSTTERAIQEQLTAMRTIGYQGTAEQMKAVYPCGTIDDVVERLQRDIESGVTHHILNPVGDIEQQLGLLIEHVLEPVRATGLPT